MLCLSKGEHTENLVQIVREGPRYNTPGDSASGVVFNIFQHVLRAVDNSLKLPQSLAKATSMARGRFSKKGAFKTLFGFRGLGPLTARAVVSILGCTYLLLGPIQANADIVSVSLVSALLAILILTTVTVSMWGLMLHRSLSVTVTPPHQGIPAGEEARVVLAVSSSQILPLTSLELSLIFEHPGASPAIVRVSGTRRAARTIFFDITFPHRGSWDIRSVECCYRDITGLVNHTWEIPQQTGIVITPPEVYESRLPILSSVQRPGDQVIDIFNKHGDPYDIKAYHPTDGLNRIVWKAFAKRGELLSRHPEASMTPEGFVVLLVVARPEDDDACGHALAYTETLEKLNLQIIGGCLGAQNRPLAHSTSDLRELLMDSVWDAHSTQTLHADAAALLDYCGQCNPGAAVSKLIIFASSDFVSSDARQNTLGALATWLESQGIAPIFCLSPSRLTSHATTRPLLARLAALVVEPAPLTNLPTTPSHAAFLSKCLRNQWEVYV